MNSREWFDYCSKQKWQLCTADVSAMQCDLAACEAGFESFKADCTATHEADNAEMIAITADRDDLRRKLEDASLANAALREAYNEYIDVLDKAISEFAGLAYVHGLQQNPDLVEHGKQCREKIAALPADGLVEEMRKYMVHMATCDKASNLSQYTPCTCGLDALLARIGGGK
jgi:hypothetical protein